MDKISCNANNIEQEIFTEQNYGVIPAVDIAASAVRW